MREGGLGGRSCRLSDRDKYHFESFWSTFTQKIIFLKKLTRTQFTPPVFVFDTQWSRSNPPVNHYNLFFLTFCSFYDTQRREKIKDNVPCVVQIHRRFIIHSLCCQVERLHKIQWNCKGIACYFSASNLAFDISN